MGSSKHPPDTHSVETWEPCRSACGNLPCKLLSTFRLAYLRPTSGEHQIVWVRKSYYSTSYFEVLNTVKLDYGRPCRDER